jgi:hypothetical protein
MTIMARGQSSVNRIAAVEPFSSERFPSTMIDDPKNVN